MRILNENKNINDTLKSATQRWINNPNNPDYWTDFYEAKPNGDGTFTIICKCVKMPYENVIEMFCDFVGAGQAYDKGDWTCQTPWNYWQKNCEGKRAMHPDSEKLIKKLLSTLAVYETLDDFVKWYNKNKEKLERNY